MEILSFLYTILTFSALIPIGFLTSPKLNLTSSISTDSPSSSLDK